MKYLLILLVASNVFSIELTYPLSFGGHAIRLYDASPTIIEDKSGSGNDGTVNSTTIIVDNNFVAEFGGGNIDCGNDTSLQGTALTVSFWAKPSANNKSLITKGTSRSSYSAHCWDIFGDGSTLNFRLSDGSISMGTASVAFPALDEWVYISATWDGTTTSGGIKLYTNAVEVSTATAANINLLTTKNLYIGGSLSWSYAGLLDNISFYGKALTPSELTSLYNAGREATKDVISTNDLSLFIDFEPPQTHLALQEPTYYYDDMLLWYPFETNNANDYSAYNRDGTIYGATWSNKWYEFGGTDRINFADQISFSDNMTVSFWYSTTDDSAWNMLFGKKTTYTDYFGVASDRGSIYIKVGSDSSKRLYYSFSTNTVYNIAITRDATNYTLYIDGDLEDTVSVGSVLPITDVGLSYPSTYASTYYIRDFRVYNRLLDADDLAGIYRRTKWTYGFTKPVILDGITHYYPFDRAMIDELGDKDGTVEGATKVDTYYSFDGVDDYLNIINTDPITDNFSVVCWFYTDTASGTQVLVDKNGSSSSAGREFGLWIQDTKLAIRNLYTTTSADTDIPTNQWNLAVLTVSSTETKVYLNGALDLTVSDVFTQGDTGTRINFGRWPYAGNTFPLSGYIGSVIMYDRDLTQAEITKIYDDAEY